jgi:predicted DNA-binding protein
MRKKEKITDKTYSTKLPVSLADRLDEKIDEIGCTISSFLKRAVEAYLDNPPARIKKE